MGLFYYDIFGVVYLLIIYDFSGYRWEEKIFLLIVMLFRGEESFFFVLLYEKEMIEFFYLGFIFR